MRRLFVFGCSFTKYDWPTWADLLSFEFDHYENWGLPGIGNRAIAERLAECHARNTISKDDVVIVQWSSHIRHDWYKDHYNKEEKSTEGWAVHHTSPFYIKHKKHTDALFSERAYVLHTLNMIILAQSLLKSTDCTWFMTSLGDLRNLGYDNSFSKREYIGSSNEILLDMVKNSQGWPMWEVFPEFQMYEDSIWNNTNWLEPLFNIVKANKDAIWSFEKDGYVDLHPTPQMHNEWLNQNLKPNLHIDYNYDSVREYIIDKFNKLKASGKYSAEEFFDLAEILIQRLRTDKSIALPDQQKLIGF